MRHDRFSVSWATRCDQLFTTCVLSTLDRTPELYNLPTTECLFGMTRYKFSRGNTAVMQKRTRMLILISGALFLSVLVWFNYSAVLPLIVKDWDLTGLQAGVVFGAFQAGYLVAIVPSGSFADRYPPKWVVGAGAFGTGVASMVFALLANGFYSGTMIRFLAGICMAGVYVPGMRFLSDWFAEDVRGRALGIYIGMFSLGSGLSFLLSSVIATATNWETAILVTSLGAIGVGPVVLLFAEESPTIQRDRTGGFGFSVLRNRQYLAAVGVYSWHNWELFGVRNWIVAFLLSTPAIAATGSPQSIAGVVAGTMILLGSAGNMLGGWLSDNWGRLRTIGLALVISGLISLVIGTMSQLSLSLLIAISLVYGVFLTMDSAPTSTAITELVSNERVGTALSIQSFVGFSTTVVSPVVFGIALDSAGYSAAFPTLAVGAAFALICLVALHYAR